MDSKMPYCFGILGALNLAVQPLYKATKNFLWMLFSSCFPRDDEQFKAGKQK